VAQIQDLLSWIDSTLTGGLPVYILGDLNLTTDTPKQPSGFQFDLFTQAGFSDLWQTGLSNSLAEADWGDRDQDSIPDMPLGTNTRTHDSRRIDSSCTSRIMVRYHWSKFRFLMVGLSVLKHYRTTETLISPVLLFIKCGIFRKIKVFDCPITTGSGSSLVSNTAGHATVGAATECRPYSSAFHWTRIREQHYASPCNQPGSRSCSSFIRCSRAVITAARPR
jgi:hypothetical protein